MAKKKMSKKMKRQLQSLVITLLVMAAYLLANHFGLLEEVAPDTQPAAAVTGGDLVVHIIDVDQADSILILGPEKNVLIDAGEQKTAKELYSYIQEQGATQLDILIATHPHADHIGGMTHIVQQAQVGQVIMSELKDSIVPTTKVYTNLLGAIADKGLKITKAKSGTEYDLGGGAKLTILAPVALYDDLNNSSVVCRLDYGSTSFLFNGDIEKEAEADILASGANLKVDVFCVPHHGSSSSSTQAYLDAAKPQMATIPLGIDNSYGHPHKEVMKRLEALNIPIYRTDLNGNIVITSDGSTLTVTTEK